MKAVIAAFNQEKALVGAFSMIRILRMDLFEALLSTHMEIMFGVFVFLLERGEEGVEGQDGEAVLHRQHSQI